MIRAANIKAQSDPPSGTFHKSRCPRTRASPCRGAQSVGVPFLEKWGGRFGRTPHEARARSRRTHCIALCCGSKPVLAEAGSGLARDKIASPVARLLPRHRGYASNTLFVCTMMRACTHESGSVIDVRFTPDATKLLRSSEIRRCARKRHMHRSKQHHYSITSSARASSVVGPARPNILGASARMNERRKLYSSFWMDSTKCLDRESVRTFV